MPHTKNVFSLMHLELPKFTFKNLKPVLAGIMVRMWD